MEVLNENDDKSNEKEEIDGKFYDAISYKTRDGLCCVCHKIPMLTRIYHKQLFCTECFHKYIWTPPKHDCSGDIQKRKSHKHKKLEEN